MWVETFYGIFFGVMARTFVPYLAELKRNPELRWKRKYIISAYAGFLLALFTSFIMYMQIGKHMGFWHAFTAAFTLQSLARSTQKALGFD
jgi:hypothetical protein